MTNSIDVAAMADDYTREIGDYCKAQLPVTLANDEYTRRVGALIVALNRQLAEHVVTSAHVHDCPMDELLDLTGKQFIRNVQHAMDAIVGVGVTRQ